MADAPGTPQPAAPAPQPDPDIESGKVLAILCYIPIFFVGLIVSIICLVQKNNSFNLFHAKQSLTLTLGCLILSAVFCIPILGLIVGGIGWIVAIVLFVIGIVNAVQGKYAALPLVGQFADKIFGSIQVEKK